MHRTLQQNATLSLSRQAILKQLPALTNHDLAQMAANGLSDAVIINAVHQHGGQFDLTPSGLISLKSNGVSDAVIQAIQVRCAAPPPSTTTTVQGVVIVRPHPVVIAKPRPVRRYNIPTPRTSRRQVVRRRW